MAMRRPWLLEPRSFLALFRVFAAHQSGREQDPIGRAGGDIDQVGIDHHVGQPAIALQAVRFIEPDDLLSLLGKDFVIAHYPAVVLVDLAIATAPIAVPLAADPQRLEEQLQGQAGARFPGSNEINHLVPMIRLCPFVGP
jgi:hypothetical protein